MVGIGLRDARNTCKCDNSGVQVEFVTRLRDEKTVLRVVEYFEEVLNELGVKSQLESLASPAESYLSKLRRIESISGHTYIRKRISLTFFVKKLTLSLRVASFHGLFVYARLKSQSRGSMPYPFTRRLWSYVIDKDLANQNLLFDLNDENCSDMRPFKYVYIYL